MATEIPLSAPVLAQTALQSLSPAASSLGAAPGGATLSPAGLAPGARQAAQEILTQLRDIRGLDPVSGWPPALGWWLVALGVLLLFYLAWRYRASLRLRIPPIPVLRIGNWRWDAGRQLRDLRQRALTQDPRRTAAELSELLRRIAMARLGREACAGLTGADWLAWLTERDPRQFDWLQRGRLLLDAPYAPPASAIPPPSHSPYAPRTDLVRAEVAPVAGPARPTGTSADWLPLIDAAYQWVLVEDQRARVEDKRRV